MITSASASGKIPSLNGLRAVSFLIVFVAHAGLERLVPGRLGVAIFFLLSGYLITTLMIRERETTGRISLSQFYTRRVLRIFPPLYTIFAATLVFLWLAHQMRGLTLPAVLSQLLFYQNYYFHGGQGLVPGLGVVWSLAVEEHFYLLFPLLMLLLIGRFKMGYREIGLTLLCICLGILAWRCHVATSFTNGLARAGDTSDCRADSILFGCVLACWEQTPEISRLFTKKRLEHFILPAALVILLSTLLIREPLFRETARYTLQAIALSPFLYYVVTFPTSLAGRVLNYSWLAALGTLSYSMYLIHYTVLLEVNRSFRSELVAGSVGLGLTVGLAALVFVFVERPVERIRKKYRQAGLIKTSHSDQAIGPLFPIKDASPRSLPLKGS